MTLQFDEASHTYTLGGKVLPSVTSILSMVSDYGDISPEVLARKATLGHQVHESCQLLIENDLDEGWLAENLPEVVPYVDGFKKFCADLSPRFIRVEQRLHHARLHYAGTLDLVAEILSNDWLIDIKTTVEIKPVAGLQTAAYNAMLPKPAKHRGVLQLKADGSYKLREFEDPSDWVVFQSLLNVHNWKSKNVK